MLPFASIVARLRAAIAPDCFLCGVQPAQHPLPACAPCIADWFAPVARCPACALPTGRPEGSCAACARRRSPPLSACWALGDYAMPLDAVVGALKFGGRIDLGHALGELLAHRLPDLPAVDRVVPLPLSDARLRHRGYNQSHEIAIPVARRLQAPLAPRLLRRTRETAEQHTLGLRARVRNVRGAFVAVPEAEGRCILLVDDVMTTGATLGAAAWALRKAGAAWVGAAVAARTQRTQAEAGTRSRNQKT